MAGKDVGSLAALRGAYRYRWKRKRLLWRAFRSRRALRPVADRSGQIRPGQVLGFTTLRNEMLRLPGFLDHYRRLGVGHFLMVDNDSTDGTDAFLRDQPDVSLWQTSASYRGSRFGVDWQNHLLRRYGSGHWCLSVDADELLVYDGDQTHDLPALTRWLAARGHDGFGALMVELFPKGPLGTQSYAPGTPPQQALPWFDGSGYRVARQPGLENLWVQGGPRDRVFFADRPNRAPTLNKLPLMRWRRGYAYVSSTHAALPRRLNHLYDGPGGILPSGALLHSKFLPDIIARTAEDQRRLQHFHNPRALAGYYDAIVQGPDLWSQEAHRYRGTDQLIRLGLITGIGWDETQVPPAADQPPVATKEDPRA